ncbi:MAG: SCO family protein [Burkholderiaceae bacterium]
MISKRQLIFLSGAGAATSAIGTTPGALQSRPGPRAGYFPNTPVLTHDGRKLRFYDDIIKGKVVAINMMYTACAGICPGNTANLKLVQEELADHLDKQVFMYSMTLRPDIDTPQALQDYVKRYAIPKGWTFLTGKPAEIDVIRRKLGFFNDDPVIDADLNQHTGMVRVGNERLDRWAMCPALGSPKQTARTILQLRA